MATVLPLVLVLVGALLPSASPLPLCTDLRAPLDQKVGQSFCGYEGKTCCGSRDESAIKKQLRSMEIPDEACSSLVKSILCSRCDPFSGDIFIVNSNVRTIPVLCNSTPFIIMHSKVSTNNFCGQVWDTCKDVPIKKSPFKAPLQGSAQVQDPSSSKLTELWQSKNEFCNAFGNSSSNEPACFDGQTVLVNSTQSPPPPKGLCLEKLWSGQDIYTNIVPHPDGSNRVFVSNVEGKIWLVAVPEEGSGGTMALNETTIFLDITDQVKHDPPLGLMGIAFHPNFASNGRFFVSYNCDQREPGSCSGKCSCNSDVGCDPSKLDPDKGGQPCQYHAVIAEFSANGTFSDAPMVASASEVRRIFTMGLPSTQSHGGQILFGPTDGYLYFMMGDGGQNVRSYNFAQNKKSLLGKIMRLDVDNIPSPQQISQLGLWGNYSVPKDNPYADDRKVQNEIWAMGLRSPWKCSFDSARPSYFFCADTGENTYEEVDLISKGGNYGWSYFEGPLPFQPLSSADAKSVTANLILPIMGYNHTGQSASITGGYVYRSRSDPCMVGRYLYADLYGSSIWTGTENPPNSGNYTSESIPFSCASDSPIQCEQVPGRQLPDLGYIFAFGEDNNKDVYFLSSKGIYRVVRPSRCNYTCPIEKEINQPPPGSPSSTSHSMRIPRLLVLFLLLVPILLL